MFFIVTKHRWYGILPTQTLIVPVPIHVHVFIAAFYDIVCQNIYLTQMCNGISGPFEEQSQDHLYTFFIINFGFSHERLFDFVAEKIEVCFINNKTQTLSCLYTLNKMFTSPLYCTLRVFIMTITTVYYNNDASYIIHIF